MPQPPRILIVDDDTIITHLVSTMLQRKGYSIVGIVETGEESLVKTAELVPDLVIMDVNLSGGMDGIDAAHYLFQLFHIPVLFITGISEEEKLDRLKCSRPYGVLFKPFTAIELTTLVDLALYNHADREKTLPNPPVGEPRKLMDNTTEAILLLDRRGRIVFLNTFASWFVDISFKEALLRHWRNVLVFLNDQTGEELKDPVTEVIRQMSVTTFDSNTALVTTTSKRRKVTVSIRPIRDDHDQLLAVAMSLREDVKKVYM